jgi:hypothetical protein
MLDAQDQAQCASESAAGNATIAPRTDSHTSSPGLMPL